MEQLNHKYELSFGQPVSFYGEDRRTPALANISNPQDLSNYVNTNSTTGLILTDHHIEFELSKTKEAGKVSKITIYNASDLVRLYLESKQGEAPLIILKAGYETEVNENTGDGLKLLFQGEVFRVEEVFEGVNRKTVILLKSGFRSMNEAFTSRSYKSGTKASTIVRDMLKDLNVPEGTTYYADLDEITLKKPYIAQGKTFHLLRSLLPEYNTRFWYEDGTANILPDNYSETRNRQVLEINANNLIGSPAPKSNATIKQEKEDGTRVALRLKTTLNGSYQIGNLVSLVSRQYEGVYEIEGISHKGSYEGHEWYSELEIKPIDGWEVRR